MSAWLLWPFAFLAGVLNTVQSGTNTTLNKALEQPVLAGMAVYGGGILGLLLMSPFLGLSFAGLGGKAAQAPWWAWTGGVIGAVYVLATLTLAGRMGAGPFTAVTLTAAVLASLAMDHFGLVGFEVHPANLWRVAGAVLMIGGVVLIARN
ncbi:DMT family transporter [Roseomonas sp. BN140053]|uniref:DMT family transporter n=1 Tax=Roseomonas sp. BN140053 TaxID=3391898 RepID=UPI0039E8DD05